MEKKSLWTKKDRRMFLLLRRAAFNQLVLPSSLTSKYFVFMDDDGKIRKIKKANRKHAPAK